MLEVSKFLFKAPLHQIEHLKQRKNHQYSTLDLRAVSSSGRPQVQLEMEFTSEIVDIQERLSSFSFLASTFVTEFYHEALAECLHITEIKVCLAL